LPEPASAIKDRPTFLTGWVVLVALLAGFFILELLGSRSALLPLPARRCCWRWRKRDESFIRATCWRAPWQIVIFSLGMYLVVYGLRNAGLTDALSAC
jgi:arsenical pump membrane protein